MDRSRIRRGGFWLLVVGIVLTAGTARGEQAPPTERKGISAVEKKAVDLGPEIPGMQGRYLRLRSGTIDPGGHNAIHTHVERPEILYVVEGTITEHRDGATKEYREGEILVGTKETKHWIENKGTARATFLVVDIVKK